jgi:hypothetical protein
VRFVNPWLLPVFLVVVGALLLWDSAVLYADGISNLALQNSAPCGQVSLSAPHSCATSSSNAEMALSVFTGSLGALTLAGGLIMSAVRWSQFRNPEEGRQDRRS